MEAHEDRSHVGRDYASGPMRPSQLPLVKPHLVSYRWVKLAAASVACWQQLFQTCNFGHRSI